MSAFFYIFLGGGIGAAARHGVNLIAGRLIGTNFAWGTPIVNIVGSFIMGLLAAYLAFKAGAAWSQHVRLFVTTGMLGGFTTFSAFSLDVALLWERNAVGQAAAYVLASVGLSVLGLFAGLWVVRAIT